MKAIAGLSLAMLIWADAVTVRPAAAAADSPTVTPATGGEGAPVVFGYFGDLDAIRYRSAEFLLSGNARSYVTAAPLTPDGKWNAVAPAPSTAPHTTRMVVHMPKDPRRFNGTVYVEWLNVSGGVDGCPDWVHSHVEVARQGAAFVLVSAQLVGVDQLRNGGDPVRYASLSHPGDSYSFDIFSQAGQAIRDGTVLDGLVARRVLAVGESQSAGRLVTYINGVQPLVDVYDGFLVHSRGRGGAPLSQEPLADVPVPLTEIRDDLDAPVLVFQAETDVANAALLARQPETHGGRVRLWEVAGTAHFDVYGLDIGTRDAGDGQGEIENLAAMRNPPLNPLPGVIECALPINAGPMHWVFNAAVYRLDRWVRHGTPPPIAPRLEALSEPGVEPVVFAVDEHGNTRGGIRTPFVDVPIARLGGTGNGARPPAFPGEEVPPTSRFCGSFGQTVPFTQAELRALYRNHGTFVARYFRATLSAVRSPFLLRQDAPALLRAATRSDIAK